ncbi:hypothetical protein ANACOL_02640 [Anaerotruncus colihominis DSM 17241]|uniref:Uncharacterized protein n=1 Tax=Anaerotruncus colihominis DSM 17241 TaxID=445972 RepID=B0PCX7_9FIRM|nr:hypothetical protein ANACOL_02640 [Anaerotruncus colihominis DSM 17241]
MSPKCNKCYISQLLSYRHQTQFVNYKIVKNSFNGKDLKKDNLICTHRGII